MANVAVIGAQWGDEGKGKIVDWLAERADMVVRFQGGHNAGHTLVVGEQIYKLSLLPSGIVRGTPSVIGNGVVLDPWAFKAEVERIGEQGVNVTPDVLMIAETCPLILPIHRDLDALREDASGAGKIGTTRRGIGPAYEDKVGGRAIRVCDLAHLDDLEPQLDRLCAHHDALRAGFKEPPVDQHPRSGGEKRRQQADADRPERANAREQRDDMKNEERNADHDLEGGQPDFVVDPAEIRESVRIVGSEHDQKRCHPAHGPRQNPELMLHLANPAGPAWHAPFCGQHRRRQANSPLSEDTRRA